MIDVRLFSFFKFSEKPKLRYYEMIPASINRINRLLSANAVAAPYLTEKISTQLILLVAGSICEMGYPLIAGKLNADKCQYNTTELTVSSRHSFFPKFGEKTRDQYCLLKPPPSNALLDLSLAVVCSWTILSVKIVSLL